MGVSAGFSPIGLGTETDGSLVQPGARAALYTLKPTPGTTELDGVWVVSEDFDAVGAMTKSTADLALITELVLNQKAREALPDDGFQIFLRTDFDGLKIGFLDPAIWRWPAHIQKQEEGTLEQMVSSYSPDLHSTYCSFKWELMNTTAFCVPQSHRYDSKQRR